MLYRKFKASMVTLCLAFMLGFSPLVFSQSASDYFKRGVKVAESGDFREALVQYQKAKEAGLDTAALKYNFAVVYYKLGQLEEAKKNFTELAKYPRFRRIAYFNLGLVANKQKDKSSAVRWFRRAYYSRARDGVPGVKADANDKKIKELAAEALKRMGEPLRKRTRTDKSWKGYVSASMVSDSNVTRVNEDLVGVTSQSDTSASLSAYGAKWLTGRESGGVRLFLSTYQQRYSTQTFYNYSRLSFGLARYDRLGSWRLRYGGTWDETYYGGNKYQNLLSADIRGRKSLSKNNQLRLRYKATQINSKNPVYDYLEGWRQQFRVGYRIKSGVDRYRIYYQLELNDRQDFVGTSPIFTSYSPTRHTLRATGWWKFPGAWVARLGGRYRTSQYNEDNILAGNIRERREDVQTRVSARLTKKLGKKWQFEIEYTAINNESSIDSESYSRSQLGLGVKRKF
jgi:tetratricopeptide (TPR) repeat protein